MPNYPTHARWGRIGAITTAIAVGAAIFLFFETLLIAIAAALGAAAATFVGSIYPDVDHHSSVPRRKAVRAFRVLVVLGVVGFAALHWESLLAMAETADSATAGSIEAAILTDGLPVPPEAVAAVIPLLVAAVLAALVNPTIGITTRQHRGWTHSVPINLVLVSVLAGGVWMATGGLPIAQRIAAVAVVGTFLVGTLIHLGLDGEII